MHTVWRMSERNRRWSEPESLVSPISRTGLTRVLTHTETESVPSSDAEGNAMPDFHRRDVWRARTWMPPRRQDWGNLPVSQANKRANIVYIAFPSSTTSGKKSCLVVTLQSHTNNRTPFVFILYAIWLEVHAHADRLDGVFFVTGSSYEYSTVLLARGTVMKRGWIMMQSRCNNPSPLFL